MIHLVQLIEQSATYLVLEPATLLCILKPGWRCWVVGSKYVNSDPSDPDPYRINAQQRQISVENENEGIQAIVAMVHGMSHNTFSHHRHHHHQHQRKSDPVGPRDASVRKGKSKILRFNDTTQSKRQNQETEFTLPPHPLQ